MHLYSAHAGTSADQTDVISDADPVLAYLDPLDEDLPSDARFALSHRELGRLLFIAAKTGARFQRQEVPYDPMAWLFSPRAMFNGCAAVDACRQRQSFVRAIVLHSLSLGFDADPDVLDTYVSDEFTIAPARPRSAKRPAEGVPEAIELSPA